MSTEKTSEQIAIGDVLWRRVPREKVVFDANLGRPRPSSNAFTDNQRDGSPMSVWEASATLNPAKLLEGFPDFYVVSFTVAEALEAGLTVEEHRSMASVTVT